MHDAHAPSQPRAVRTRRRPVAPPRPEPPVLARRVTLAGHRLVVLSIPSPTFAAFAILPEAERDVTLLALRGLSNHAIAAERQRSTRTVANQLASAFKKLGVRSRIELASLAGAS